MFLGFSVISGIEFVYYFTVRLSCSILRSHAHPEERNPSMETSEMSGTGQYLFSQQVSTTTPSLAFGKRIMEIPGRYRRSRMDHEIVFDI